jgi:hypothetical protein
MICPVNLRILVKEQVYQFAGEPDTDESHAKLAAVITRLVKSYPSHTAEILKFIAEGPN